MHLDTLVRPCSIVGSILCDCIIGENDTLWTAGMFVQVRLFDKRQALIEPSVRSVDSTIEGADFAQEARPSPAQGRNSRVKQIIDHRATGP